MIGFLFENESSVFMAVAAPPLLVVLVTLHFTVGYPLCQVYLTEADAAMVQKSSIRLPALPAKPDRSGKPTARGMRGRICNEGRDC